jgi:hypothetical protein
MKSASNRLMVSKHFRIPLFWRIHQSDFHLPYGAHVEGISAKMNIVKYVIINNLGESRVIFFMFVYSRLLFFVPYTRIK